MNLLEINNLSIEFPDKSSGTCKKAVDDISFSIGQSEMLALVGESGSGKSISALSILKLLPEYAKISGNFKFNNKEVNQKDILKIRGQEISIIFQEPMTSLNPLHTIGRQISESLYLHGISDKKDIEKRVVESLNEVGLNNLTQRLNAYPHELSGGQRQRVMIAMALINRPKLLVADEPTTALDVTVQKQILELLRNLQKDRQMSILLITHDLSVVEKYADRTVVMQNGKIVEQGPTHKIINNPAHNYTKRLMFSIPRGIREEYLLNGESVLRTEKLKVDYVIKRNFFGKPIGLLNAVKDANIEIREGETLAVVGESGSGKSTLAYAILRLIESEGAIVVAGKNLERLEESELRNLRNNMQIVFQDPFSSLNPRMSVGEIIAEGLYAHFPDLSDEEINSSIIEALDDVGLDAEFRHRYPHEFSGGQRQRIGIARCMILNPKLILLDEPSSALDVSTQSEILKLLIKLQVKKNLAYLFISHDLRVVRSIAHKIIVMQNGAIVESGKSKDIFNNPQNNYTKKLLDAALIS